MNSQLTLHLVLAAVKAHPRKIAGVADEIDYSRTSLSLYLAGKYPAQKAIERAILARYNRRNCPHTGEDIAPEICRKKALAPQPYGGAARERQWHACQNCPHKPIKE